MQKFRVSRLILVASLFQALDTFNTAIVSPVYYVSFTTLTIIASAIMYKDWSGQDASSIASEICGFVTILCGTIILHSTREQEPTPTYSEREGISTNLQQTEEWLYEDGDDESERVYTGKLEDLKKLVDPIESRYKDEEARAQSTRDLLKCIVEYKMAVKSLPTSDGDMVINECNKAEKWLRDKTQQQDSLPKNTDPLLWSNEIKAKAEALDMS